MKWASCLPMVAHQLLLQALCLRLVVYVRVVSLGYPRGCQYFSSEVANPLPPKRTWDYKVSAESVNVFATLLFSKTARFL